MTTKLLEEDVCKCVCVKSNKHKNQHIDLKQYYCYSFSWKTVQLTVLGQKRACQDDNYCLFFTLLLFVLKRLNVQFVRKPATAILQMCQESQLIVVWPVVQ